MMTDTVECLSSSGYADRPTALYWRGARLTIVKVIKQWRVPEGKCFRVQTIGSMEFELCYLENESEWHIHQV
ncbi:MAG: hypothetical protein KAT29_04360 [Anaerolineales bacterium]|nr:hypothetical protein [Anaerolineales bacterium]